jgi:hypothetical protein
LNNVGIMEVKETIWAYGHTNIQGTHKTTLEITKEKHLSKMGDCIIAVSADKALADLSPKFKERLRQENAKLAILIEADGIVEVVNAFGSLRLGLSHPADIVVRKSGYICSRTLGVHADKAACDLSRELVQKLRNSKQRVRISFTAEI